MKQLQIRHSSIITSLASRECPCPWLSSFRFVDLPWFQICPLFIESFNVISITTTIFSGRRQGHSNSCRDQILKRRLWRTCSDARCEESQGQGFQDLPWYVDQPYHHQVHALVDFLPRKWRNVHCGAWLWNWFSCWQHLQLYAPGCSSLKWEAFSGLFEYLQVFQRLQELHSKGDIKEVLCKNKDKVKIMMVYHPLSRCQKPRRSWHYSSRIYSGDNSFILTILITLWEGSLNHNLMANISLLSKVVIALRELHSYTL